MELKQFTEIVNSLTEEGLIVRVFDPEKKDLIYSLTEEGARFYNTALTVTGRNSNPVDSNVFTEFKFATWFVKYTSRDNVSKFGLSETGLHRFFVLDRIIDKTKIPVPTGIRVAQGLFKATQVMGKTADMMSSIAGKMEKAAPSGMTWYMPQPTKSKKEKIPTRSITKHSASWEAPKKGEFERLNNLSKFPKNKRKNWFDV